MPHIGSLSNPSVSSHINNDSIDSSNEIHKQPISKEHQDISDRLIGKSVDDVEKTFKLNPISKELTEIFNSESGELHDNLKKYMDANNFQSLTFVQVIDGKISAVHTLCSNDESERSIKRESSRLNSGCEIQIHQKAEDIEGLKKLIFHSDRTIVESQKIKLDEARPNSLLNQNHQLKSILKKKVAHQSGDTAAIEKKTVRFDNFDRNNTYLIDNALKEAAKAENLLNRMDASNVREEQLRAFEARVLNFSERYKICKKEGEQLGVLKNVPSKRISKELQERIDKHNVNVSSLRYEINELRTIRKELGC